MGIFVSRLIGAAQLVVRVPLLLASRHHHKPTYNIHTFHKQKKQKTKKNRGHTGSFAESETRHTAGDADAADRHLSFFWMFDAQAPRGKSCYYGAGACRAKEALLAALCGSGVEGKRRGCRASSCFLLPYEEGTTAHGCIILIIGHSF